MEHLAKGAPPRERGAEQLLVVLLRGAAVWQASSVRSSVGGFRTASIGGIKGHVTWNIRKLKVQARNEILDFCQNHQRSRGGISIQSPLSQEPQFTRNKRPFLGNLALMDGWIKGERS